MTWLIAAVAVYRLTRLVTADFITERLRTWAVDKHPTLGYLLSCDWCLSMWIAPPVVLVVMAWPEAFIVRVTGLVLALSAFTGILATVERQLED